MLGNKCPILQNGDLLIHTCGNNGTELSLRNVMNKEIIVGSSCKESGAIRFHTTHILQIQDTQS